MSVQRPGFDRCAALPAGGRHDANQDVHQGPGRLAESDPRQAALEGRHAVDRGGPAGGVLLKPVDKKRKFTIDDLRGIVKYKGPPRSIEEMNAAIDEEFRRRHARGRY
jgi:hypothetical protein